MIVRSVSVRQVWEVVSGVRQRSGTRTGGQAGPASFLSEARTDDYPAPRESLARERIHVCLLFMLAYRPVLGGMSHFIHSSIHRRRTRGGWGGSNPSGFEDGP